MVTTFLMDMSWSKTILRSQNYSPNNVEKISHLVSFSLLGNINTTLNVSKLLFIYNNNNSHYNHFLFEKKPKTTISEH